MFPRKEVAMFITLAMILLILTVLDVLAICAFLLSRNLRAWRYSCWVMMFAFVLFMPLVISTVVSFDWEKCSAHAQRCIAVHTHVYQIEHRGYTYITTDKPKAYPYEFKTEFNGTPAIIYIESSDIPVRKMTEWELTNKLFESTGTTLFCKEITKYE